MIEKIKKEMKCKVCKRVAEYEEWSPDGPPDYFCSPTCHLKYKQKMAEKGISWRALPLAKIDDGSYFVDNIVYKLFIELEKAFWLLYYDFSNDETTANKVKDKFYEIRVILKDLTKS